MDVMTAFDVFEPTSGHVIFNSKLFDPSRHVKDISGSTHGKQKKLPGAQKLESVLVNNNLPAMTSRVLLELRKEHKTMGQIIKLLAARQLELEALFNDLQMFHVSGYDDFADAGTSGLKKDDKLIKYSEESKESGGEEEVDATDEDESGRHETRMKAHNDIVVANTSDDDNEDTSTDADEDDDDDA